MGILYLNRAYLKEGPFKGISPELVKKGGVISIITYHSVEDRLVKRFIQNGCFESEPIKNKFGVSKTPFKKVFKFLKPSEGEIKINNRARSAKLRSAVRV